jgi:predicted kinase
MSTPILMILSGISGSGKSMLTKNMQRFFDGYLCIIEPDDFRMILTGQPFHSPAEDMVWSHVKTAVRALLRKKHTVAVDATSLTKFTRNQWVTVAREEEVFVEIHCVVTPLGIAKERNNTRVIPVPNSVIQKQALSMEIPRLEDGFRSVFIYNDELKEIGFGHFDPSQDPSPEKDGLYVPFSEGHWKRPYACERDWTQSQLYTSPPHAGLFYPL